MNIRTIQWLGGLRSLAVWLVLATLAKGADAAIPVTYSEKPDDSAAVAWIRFVEGDEQFDSIPYHWLGRGELKLTFDVAPSDRHALELLWGSKDDMRTANLVVNGRSLPLSKGGYRGFRWLRVPLPAGIKGERCEVTLQAMQAPAAFLGEVRLTAPGGDSLRPDLRQARYRSALLAVPGRPAEGVGEAFPEMRKVWDREPSRMTGRSADPEEELFRQAERNGRLANEALFRCRRFVDGWLAHADPATGLIPRNLTQSRDFWNGRDSAADNYAFMVLTAAITDPPLLNGRVLEMLRTEQRVTARVDRLADDYSFSKKGWRREPFDLDATIFDSAEYVKDGLIPVTEWLGPSPWSERMIGLIDDIWKHASIETPFGKLPTRVFEVNGDLLQSCARLYWFTGQRKYLDWAVRLGDFYLLGDQHPTRDLKELRLMDHGGEVVNGLTELYAAVSRAEPAKQAAYRQPLHELLDCILAKGANPDGMLYSWFNPRTGEHSPGLCDTWGYIYDGFYTVYLLDGTPAYRDAVRKALGNLKGKYEGMAFADKSADGHADSIEGAINLINREPIDSAAAWAESQIRLMWAIQKPDGIIEGWHGDGNSARTSIMFALWKTQGITVQPWRPDVRFGAARGAGGRIHLALVADQPWEGRVFFDRPRHKEWLHLPLDYPRINQFPEWFAVEAAARYAVQTSPGTGRKERTGRDLLEGLPLRLKAGEEIRWAIETLQ